MLIRLQKLEWCVLYPSDHQKPQVEAADIFNLNPKLHMHTHIHAH
jgi:hypothetical protein